MLIVAPSGITNEAVSLLTFRSFSQVSSVTGKVASYDAVEKATICGRNIALKNVPSFCFEKSNIAAG